MARSTENFEKFSRHDRNTGEWETKKGREDAKKARRDEGRRNREAKVFTYEEEAPRN